jgi:WD40 repeat protein
VKLKYIVSMGSVEHPEAAGGFADFDAGHRDLVSVTKFNFYGNRIVTASTDHRMKVWDLKDGQWQLTDTWRAHDAEIRDVRAQREYNVELPDSPKLTFYNRQFGTVLLQANILEVWVRT